MLVKDRPEYRHHLVGIVAETEIGEVYAVDCSVVLVAVKFHRFHIVEIPGILRLELLVIATESSVLGREIAAEGGILASIGIYRTFKHHDRDLGTRRAQYVDKPVGESVAHHLGTVGHGVDKEKVGIGYLGHGTRHAAVHLALAAESEVYHLAVQLARYYVCGRHAGARRAASLKYAGAVCHYLLALVNEPGIAGCEHSAAVNLDFELLHAVVKRQVDHVLRHTGSVEIAHICGLYELGFLVLDIGAVGVDMAPAGIALPHVQVGALEPGVGHMNHMRVPQQGVAHAYAARVGGEAHAYARRALLAAPEVGAHTVGKIGRKAPVGALGVVESFVDDSQLAGVGILPRFLGVSSKSRQGSERSKKCDNDFFHGFIVIVYQNRSSSSRASSAIPSVALARITVTPSGTGDGLGSI